MYAAIRDSDESEPSDPETFARKKRMSVTNRFTTTLWESMDPLSRKIVEGSSTPFQDVQDDEDSAFVLEALTAFAQDLEANELDEDSDSDLETIFDAWCECCEITDPATIDILKGVLVETAKEAFGEGSDSDIRSLLSVLKTTPKVTYTTPNKEGMTPLAGEHGVKAFLTQLKVAKYGDAYGNDGFDASKYKAFDREKNHFGYNYSAANDYNNQKPSRPLQNPTLNVSTDNKAFEAVYRAVDSVGQGFRHQYKVANLPSRRYLCKIQSKLFP
jgi:hypothetical protein